MEGDGVMVDVGLGTQLPLGAEVIRAALETPEVKAAAILLPGIPTVQVLDTVGFRAAAEQLGMVTDARRSLLDARRALGRPLRALQEQIGTVAEELDGPLAAAQATLNDVMTRWRQAEEVLAAQAAADAREATEAALELDADAPPPAVEWVGPPPRTVDLADGGKVSARVTWGWEVEDEALVPRELCSPDRGKIAAAVRAGSRNIPGVRVFRRDGYARTKGGG